MEGLDSATVAALGCDVARVILVCTCLLALVGAAPAEADGAEDRVVIVGDLTVARGEVAHDVVVADGDVTVSGRVTGDVVVAKGKVKIAVTVKGDVLAIVDAATIAPGGRVDGDVQYVDEKPEVAPGAHVGGKVKRINVDKAAGPVGLRPGSAPGWRCRSRPCSWACSRCGSYRARRRPRLRPAKTAWVARSPGASACSSGSILAVILLVTLPGLPLGLLMLLALLPLYSMGYTTSAWVFGRRILGGNRGRILAFVVGLAILRLIALIPILGGLAWFLATVFGLGVLFVAARRGGTHDPTAGTRSA